MAPRVHRPARDDGYRIVSVPETLARKLPKAVDIKGEPIVGLDVFQERWNESFQFSFVEPDELTRAERVIFDQAAEIIRLGGRRPAGIRAIRISLTMRINARGTREAIGCWDEASQQIVIRRDQLASLATYAGTLLHEIVHVGSDAPDLSRDFEDGLTALLGTVARKALGPSSARKGTQRVRG